MLFWLGLALAQVKVHLFGRQLGIMCGLLIQIVNHRSGLIGRGKIPIGGKKVVPRANINVETLLDEADVFIKLATECGETASIIRLESERRGRWLIL